MTENTFMLFSAALIGVLGGVGAVIFRKMIHWVESGVDFWPFAMPEPLKLFLLFGFVLALCRSLSRRFAPEAAGHGVPEIIEAVTVRGGKIRARVGFIKTILSALTLGVGGSCGAEGPIALIGASTGSKFGQFLKVNANRLKIFAACGAASGIAATFNAPLGGFMFAVEIVLMDFGFTKVAPIVVSTILASTTAHYWFHGEPLLALTPHEISHDFWLVGCLLLGLSVGLISAFYIWALDKTEVFFSHRWFSKSSWKAVLLASLMFTGLVFLFADVQGVGGEVMESLFSGQVQKPIAILFFLLIAKILATGITLGAGGSGGIFFPGLFVGGVGGVMIGQIFNEFFPGLFGGVDPGTYGVLGMGAMVSGAMRAPLTGILITYELNNAANYNLILPLMFVCVISTLVSKQLIPQSIFSLRLARRGTLVPRGRDMSLTKTIQVSECFETNYYSVTPEMSLQALFRLSLVAGPHHTRFFVCEGQSLIGAVHIHKVRGGYAKAKDLAKEIKASDIMGSAQPVLAPQDTLENALRLFEKHHLEELPVVEESKVLGVLTLAGAWEAYNQALKSLHSTQQVGDSIAAEDLKESIDLGDGLSIVEIPIPKPFVGKTVQELQLPSHHQVQLLMLKSSNGRRTEVVLAQTRLEEDQRLVLMGTKEEVEKISRL